MCKLRFVLYSVVLAAIVLSSRVSGETVADIEESIVSRIYEKKASWSETILASRARLTPYLAEQEEVLRNVQLGPWYVTEPVRVVDFEEAAFPEEDVDLGARDAGGNAVWRERSEFVDGKVHALGDDFPASSYLFRTITADKAMTFIAGFGSNDGLEVWLNERKIHSMNTSRSAAPDQDKLLLNLKEGQNTLLLKIFNGGKSCGFYFSPCVDPALLLWEKLEADFRAETMWLRRDLDIGERIALVRGNEAVKLEMDVVSGLFSELPFIPEDLAKAFRSLVASKSDCDERQWLGLYARACAFRDNTASFEHMNMRTLAPAVEFLAYKYPEAYPDKAELLGRLDDFQERFGAIQKSLPANGGSVGSSDSAEFGRFVNDLGRFQRRLLVEKNPVLDFDKLVFVRRYTYQSSHYYTDFIDGCKLFGGNLCILDLKSGRVTDLVPELDGGIFGRFDLSFDAKRIVFGYKSAIRRGFRIYEVGIDGGGLRQLTFDPRDEKERIEKYQLKWHSSYMHHTDDMHPCYLPEGRIVFVSTRCERGILCDAPDILTSTVLYAIDADGKNMEILSAGSVSEEVPTVMNDGRILYTRWEYVDKGASAVKCLWAMRPDGSGSVEIYGNDHAFPSFYNGRAIPNTSGQFTVIGGPHMPLGVGAVIKLDIRHPIRTRKPMTYLTPEIDIRGEHGYHHLRGGRWVKDREGPFFDDPYALSEEFMLVSYNPDRNVHDKNGYGLYLLDVFGNRVPIYRDPTYSCWQAMPLVGRSVPVLPSVLPDNPPEGNRATVVMSDVYVGLDGVEPGAIKYIRVMEHVARPWSARRFWGGDEFGQQHSVITKKTHLGLKLMHGIVPVEEDGSAYFTVPADKNIFFQALDEDFMEVQRMRTFVDFRPGEKRSCIGCHELRQYAPGNKAIMALAKPPVEPGPQPGGIAPRAIHYPSDVQPILDKHCIQCHGEKEPKGKLDLTGEMTDLFTRSYTNIIARGLVKVVNEIGPKMGNVAATPPYTWGSHASKLVTMIRAGHGDVKLSRPEFIKLVTWVDSNAQFYGSYFGRRNLKFKDHPNFRPIPTVASASGHRPIKDEKER